jgi:hypothetical protein
MDGDADDLAVALLFRLHGQRIDPLFLELPVRPLADAVLFAPFLTSVKFTLPNRPSLGGGPVGKYLRSIRVTDANGDEITIHEYEEREFLTRKHRFSLETGELAEEANGGFKVVATGEMLIRVPGPRKSGPNGIGG